MQHSMLALAMLALSSSAVQAQSNATVYGIVDGGLRNQTNTTAGADSKLSVSSNGLYLANRIGFNGTEDLGNGMRARFMLETGFNTGTGGFDNANSVLFNRSAWVSLGGKWGDLIVGRQYTVAYASVLDFNPVGTKYISLVPLGAGAGTSLPAAATAAGLGASATSGSRFNNDLQYRGNFGPVMLLAEYSAGEQSTGIRNGAAQAVGMKYNAGDIGFGASYTSKKTVLGQDNHSYTLGGRYSFGAAKLMFGRAEEKQESLSAGSFRNQQAWTGLVYALSPQVELIGAWYHSRYRASNTGERDLYLLSASYALSKRTVLYASIDRNLYAGALIPTTRQSNQTGVALGLNHGF